MCSTITFLVRTIIQEHRLSHDPVLGTFTVIGSEGKPHVVKLFPDPPTCSCPATSQCYHLLAVKMSLGMPLSDKTKVNLTQLRLNQRSKGQKKSGRKRARPGYTLTQSHIKQALIF